MSEKIRLRLIDLFILVLAGILLYFLLKYAFFLIFPIFLSFLFSEGIRKSLDRLTPLTPIVKRILTVLVLLIFFSLLSLVTVLLAERILHYAAKCTEFLSENMEDISHFCKEKTVMIKNNLSDFLHTDLTDHFSFHLPDIFGRWLQKIIEHLPKWIGAFVSFIPRFFISSIIFFVSCYYFSCDWERISAFFSKKIKKERREQLANLKKQFFLSLRGYTKAYFLLFLLSFSQLFFGLVLLRIRGAFSIAFTIALIDLLPVLGCGTVLIPWALVSLLSGNYSLGIWLLILYLVTLVIRQIAEPKILGSSIGLHPLISLLLVIIGLRFFGLCGMILFPLCASCLFQANKMNTEKEKGL